MPVAHLRIHHFLPASRSNGPGLRAVIWVQGCTLACPGCFNPDTHHNLGGERLPVDALFHKICSTKEPIEGLTISGGEPLQQLAALLVLLEQFKRETSLSVLIFTGFTWEEIQRMPAKNRLLSLVDVMIAGRYQQNRRVARGLLGSANKSIHFLSPRYAPSDLETTPEAELIIDSSGRLVLSGIDPLVW